MIRVAHADADPIPLVKVKHGAPRRIIAIDAGTSVRHCALPKPIALIDRGGDVVTVLAGGREMSWSRWMADMASWKHRR